MNDSTRPADSIIQAGDITLMVRLVLLASLSWVTPERYWPAIARGLARALIRVRTRFSHDWLIFRGHLEPTIIKALPTANLAHRCVARMQGFRDYRPGGWRPEIEVVGAEHIESGLGQGNGVVLWFAGGFAYSVLVTKKGLYEAGYQFIQLGRPCHGGSPTKFGVHVLNPVWTRIEDRYLAERVVIRDNDSRSALQALRSRLEENRIVCVRASDQARRTVEVDVLGATVRVATGPLHLARTTHAVVLPTFTVLSDRGLVVNVEESLMNAGDDDQEQTYEVIAQRYARRLEPYLLEYPDQWSQNGMSILHDPVLNNRR